MKKYIYLVFLLLSTNIFSQNIIEGYIKNGSSEALIGATVVLLESSDSTMVSFCLSDDNGRFRLSEHELKDYILQISYLGHSNYVELISVSNSRLTIPEIVLTESSEVLKEITISAEKIPMGVRGDTISYNAAAFKTRANATVEDLLRKLPGIEVERNGNIKAQGEDVDNVLVDGKEFFGGDPKMATKNLEAEAVEKVEVYDKKSEIAEFTGIDDGEEEKTINLKLKEDHKQGGFGNANLSGGTEDTYESKLNYFRFSPKLQASLILAANNINKETFSMNDRIEFMGGIGNMISGGGMILGGQGRISDGINTSFSAGANLNYDFSSKIEWRSHYLKNKVINNLSRNTDISGFTQNFNYSNIDELISDRTLDNHQLNTQLRLKANAFTEILFKNNFLWNDRNNTERIKNNYYIEDDFQGFSESSNFASSTNKNFESRILLKRKFAQKGRNFIASVTYKNTTDESQDSIENINRIALNPFNVFQNQFYGNDSEELNVSAKYTEPLSSKYFLSLDYTYGRNIESPFRNYFDLTENSSTLNNDLSAQFEKYFNFHSSGISLRRNSKKLKLSVGLTVQLTKLEAITEGTITGVNDNYTHLLPNMVLDYKIKGSKNLSIDYFTTIAAPQLQQMLPFPNNLNANFAIIGNPELIPEYRHRIGFNINSFDNFNFSSFWAHLNFSYVKNKIVNKVQVNEQLFQTIEAINTDNQKEASAYINFSRPFKPLKINYRVRTRYRYASYNSFINNLESSVVDDNLNIKLSINNRKTDNFYVESGVSYDLNHRRYGINSDFNQSYFNTNYFMDLDWFIGKTWTLSSQYNYTMFSSESFADSPKYNIWTVSLSKLFLNDRLEITLIAFDILQDNIAYNRSGGTNYIQQSYFNQLTSYYMLGINYKIGKTRNDKGGFNIEID